MVTAVDLRKVLTTDIMNELAADSGLPDDDLLEAAIDAAYNHVIPYLRQQKPDIADKSDVPALLDDKVLTLAKWYLYQRRNVPNDWLDREREYVESFLMRIARGEIALEPTPMAADEGGPAGASGNLDVDSLTASKLFRLW